METICGLRLITVLVRKIWRLDENKSVENLMPSSRVRTFFYLRWWYVRNL